MSPPPKRVWFASVVFGIVQKQVVCLRRLGIPEDAASDLDVCPIQPAVFANALAAPKRRNSDNLFLDDPFAAGKFAALTAIRSEAMFEFSPYQGYFVGIGFSAMSNGVPVP